MSVKTYLWGYIRRQKMSIEKINFSYPAGTLQSNFDTQEMTALELASKTSKKVDECVELVNGVEQSAIEATAIVDEMRLTQEQFATENNDIRQQLVTDNQNFIQVLNDEKDNFINGLTTSKNVFESTMTSDLNAFKSDIEDSKEIFETTMIQGVENIIENSASVIENDVNEKVNALIGDGTIEALINEEIAGQTNGRIESVEIAFSETTGYGVVNGLGVNANGTPNMSVLVSTGVSHLVSGKRKGYIAPTTVNISVSNALYPRKDIIYIDTLGVITCGQGTAEQNPVTPNTPTNCILLAEITVRANTTSIIQTDITDKRDLKLTLEGLKEMIENQTSTDTEFLLKQYVSYYGAVGDNSTDDTQAIQNAFDSVLGKCRFDGGSYKISDELVLSRNIDLEGVSQRFVEISARNLPANKSALKITFSDNFGNLDVRNWSMKNIGIACYNGGKHALYIKDGFSIITSEIKNCNFMGYSLNGGYDLYVESGMAHSKISLCTFNTRTYFNFGDANLIEKNLFYGNDIAITLNLELGVYNNTIRDNTIVNRDGCLRIINGDSVRFVNNQVELMGGVGVNQNAKSTMLWIEGLDRRIYNTVISENNFGGGTSVNYLIYIDNATETVIEKNKLISCNNAEIFFTANAKYNHVKMDNTVLGSISNPRTRKMFTAEIVDNGVGNSGVMKTVNGQNGWGNIRFYKDDNNMVHFLDSVYGGVVSEDTILYQMPDGFYPVDFTLLSGVTLAGLVILKHNGGGYIQSVGIASNSVLTINSYPCAQHSL